MVLNRESLLAPSPRALETPAVAVRPNHILQHRMAATLSLRQRKRSAPYVLEPASALVARPCPSIPYNQ